MVVVNKWKGAGRPWLTDRLCGEQRLIHVVWSSRRATVAQKLMVVQIGVKIQSSFRFVAYGDQLLTPVHCWRHQQGDQNWTMEQKKLAWSDVSHGRPCAALTWVTPDTRIERGQADRGSVVLWTIFCRDPGSCHPCTWFFNTYQLPKHCCRLCTAFHWNSIPWCL